MSSIGSMTSAFAPEPYCLEDLYIDDENPNLDLNPFMDPKCLPPAFPEEATTKTFDFYYYSPAICPSGYTSACEESCLAKSLATSETAMRCCPIDYACVPGVNYCSSTITSATEATFTDDGKKVTTVPPLWYRKAFALGVYVRHQSSDLELFASATEGAATGVHTAVETDPSNADTESDTNSKSTGLATGVKIAIGVVVPVVVIALCVLMFFFWRRRKSKKSQPDATAQPPGWVKPELDSSEVEPTMQRMYDSRGPVKMPPNMYELQDNGVYYEMEGQQRQGR
ncbi:hypothetical protein FQN54_000236 [Arachnomyces sp. PD_36]|nr:hypothetical protein FQN54_000236 [Arachnomyces sp. PD_36]